jgi:hypothetical protein
VAIAIETSGSATTGNASSITTNFTVVTSSANYLVGLAGYTHGSSTRTITQTYAGTNVPSLVSVNYAASPNIGSAILGLASPASGANDLVTSFGASVDDIVHGFISLTGANSTQSGTGSSATGFPSGGGGQPAVTVTGVANGMVIGNCCDNCAAASLSTAETERWEANSNVNQDTTVNAAYNTSSGSVQMDWTGPNSAVFAVCAFPFAASAGGAASSGVLIAM